MATATAGPDLFEGEQCFILPGVDWGQYVTINDAFPERRGLRMIYVDGSLTLLTLSRRHDWFADYLDAIIKAVAIGCGIDIDVAGSATLRLERKTAGVEGDRTYYFGPNAEIMGGPIDIDLTTQPPPDLAIEVEVTHAATEAITTYARLGVPEVWRFDARRRTLAFLVLGEDASYRPAPRSRNLPMLTTDDVLAQIKLAEETNSLSRWSAQLNEWVHTTIVPRVVEG